MTSFVEVPATRQSLAQRKLVYGIGTNDAKYLTQRLVNGSRMMCPYYQRWVAMIERCYSARLHKVRPTYSDCEVSLEWLTFSNFRAWMINQDWQGMELDKDLLSKGNKTYCKDLCIFIPSQLNSLLNDCGSNRGDMPVGVCFHKSTGRFEAYCRTNGKQNYLGLFNNPEDASGAYKKFKSAHIINVAKDYFFNKRLYLALISAAAL